MFKYVDTPYAPKAIGPYSQAIIYAGTMYTSGQIPLDPTTGEIVGSSIEDQTEQVMKNLNAILKDQSAEFTDVIKTTCYLSDMSDFAAFNKVYSKYFIGKPARSCVAVKELPKKVLCEVEAVVALL